MSVFLFGNPRLIWAVLSVVAAGVVINYFRLDSLIIIAGFRFHISAIIFLLFSIKEGLARKLKNELTDPTFKSKIAGVSLVVIPVLVPGIFIYFLEGLRLADPDYFYEFGISSIIDYPIYLLWNAPQLVIFYLFGKGIVEREKWGGVLLFILFSGFFLYTILAQFLIESNEISLSNISEVISLIAYIGAAVLYVRYLSNLYYFIGVLFTLPWIIFLAIGTDSQLVVNVLFAAQYESWEGFLSIRKPYNEYIFPGAILILILTILIVKIRGTKSKVSERK